jgi:hypothetical protein
MLRIMVIALGVGLLVTAIWVAFIQRAPWPVALECLIFGVLILIGTLLEGHYRSRRAAGAGWQKTGERFLDPTTGTLTDVRYDPQTGLRSYEPSDSNRFPPV